MEMSYECSTPTLTIPDVSHQSISFSETKRMAVPNLPFVDQHYYVIAIHIIN